MGNEPVRRRSCRQGPARRDCLADLRPDERSVSSHVGGYDTRIRHRSGRPLPTRWLDARQHLAARESEGRALASEVLHLYREVHLIEQLSEQLAALLESSVGQPVCAGAGAAAHPCHARRHPGDGEGGWIPDTSRVIRPSGNADGTDDPAHWRRVTLRRFDLERGIAEIVNDCAADPRALDSERNLKALICAPLRAGQRPLASSRWQTLHLGRLIPRPI